MDNKLNEDVIKDLIEQYTKRILLLEQENRILIDFFNEIESHEQGYDFLNSTTYLEIKQRLTNKLNIAGNSPNQSKLV